jgi:hypothetical protein
MVNRRERAIFPRHSRASAPSHDRIPGEILPEQFLTLLDMTANVR